mmetsp:Transcript_1980/g.5919  ORF Transcript_1980/g.5919 Transcript_1980/m.5919 type:complete len:197 (+) Transcript_1980:255-845(+)
MLGRTGQASLSGRYWRVTFGDELSWQGSGGSVYLRKRLEGGRAGFAMDAHPKTPNRAMTVEGAVDSPEFALTLSAKKRPPPPAGLSSGNATPRRINVCGSRRKSLSREALDGGDKENTGSVVRLTHIRASRLQKEHLGCDTVLSPVRKSARIRARTPARSASKPIEASLDEVNYAYVPNSTVKETYFSDGTAKRLF